jgi:hypothetical protein
MSREPHPSRVAFYAMTESLGWRSLPKEADYLAAGLCGKRLDCGGLCCLVAKHEGLCECCGDDPGEPDSCPA